MYSRKSIKSCHKIKTRYSIRCKGSNAKNSQSKKNFKKFISKLILTLLRGGGWCNFTSPSVFLQKNLNAIPVKPKFLWLLIFIYYAYSVKISRPYITYFLKLRGSSQGIVEKNHRFSLYSNGKWAKHEKNIKKIHNISKSKKY